MLKYLFCSVVSLECLYFHKMKYARHFTWQLILLIVRPQSIYVYRRVIRFTSNQWDAFPSTVEFLPLATLVVRAPAPRDGGTLLVFVSFTFVAMCNVTFHSALNVYDQLRSPALRYQIILVQNVVVTMSPSSVNEIFIKYIYIKTFIFTTFNILCVGRPALCRLPLLVTLGVVMVTVCTAS